MGTQYLGVLSHLGLNQSNTTMRAAGDCPGTSSKVTEVCDFLFISWFSSWSGVLWLLKSASSGGLDSLSQLVDLCPHFLDNSHEMVISGHCFFFRLLWLLLWGDRPACCLQTKRTICLVEQFDPTPKKSFLNNRCLSSLCHLSAPGELGYQGR